MRKFVCLFLLAMAQPLWAWDAVPQKVAAGVYAFIGETGPRTVANEGMNANTGFIITDAGVVVIDSGSSRQVAQKIESAIRQLTPQPITLVINTGGQDHRWLGNGHFAAQGIPLLAHEKTVADIAERGGMQAENLGRVLGSAFAGTLVQKPTRTFSNRETITLGKETIELIFAGGGHTPGDSIVWLPARRVAFSGDIVYVDRLLGVLPMSNIGHWLRSFAALDELQPELIVPGHGTPTNRAKATKETHDYLLTLRAHMKQAVAGGDDLQRAIDTLDDKAFANLPVYPELRGPNASRAYLEAETE
jgi:glyoxylase-like metal-dependent hydrolase (beta-lactamase superfamily II)